MQLTKKTLNLLYDLEVSKSNKYSGVVENFNNLL